MHQNIKLLLKGFNLHKPIAGVIGATIMIIGAAIVAEFHTPTFDCRVGTTHHMYNGY